MPVAWQCFPPCWCHPSYQCQGDVVLNEYFSVQDVVVSWFSSEGFSVIGICVVVLLQAPTLATYRM